MHLRQRRFGLSRDYQPKLASEFFNSLDPKPTASDVSANAGTRMRKRTR